MTELSTTLQTHASSAVAPSTAAPPGMIVVPFRTCRPLRVMWRNLPDLRPILTANSILGRLEEIDRQLMASITEHRRARNDAYWAHLMGDRNRVDTIDQGATWQDGGADSGP